MIRQMTNSNPIPSSSELSHLVPMVRSLYINAVSQLQMREPTLSRIGFPDEQSPSSIPRTSQNQAVIWAECDSSD